MTLKTTMLVLWRSGRVAPLLLIAQVALALAALANISYVVFERFETTGRATGIDVPNVFWVASQGYTKDYDQGATIRDDLDILNALPHVAAAGASNAVPQTFESARTLVSADSGMHGSKRLALVYQFTERSVDALGLKLVAGRALDRASISPAPGGLFGVEAIITRALATRLFGSSSAALGKPLYHEEQGVLSSTIVGVVEFMQAAPYFAADADFVYEIAFTGALPTGKSVNYLVRGEPGYRDEVMRTALQRLQGRHAGRYLARAETLEQTVTLARRDDRHGALVMAVLATFMLGVTMLGLFGFASYAVTRRMREIGTRRAIGATRGDIVRQFLQENLLVTTAGSAVGILLSLAFAIQLSLLLELPKLPTAFIALSVALVYLCGLLAALLPAIRGGRVPPATVTRSR